MSKENARNPFRDHVPAYPIASDLRTKLVDLSRKVIASVGFEQPLYVQDGKVGYSRVSYGPDILPLYLYLRGCISTVLAELYPQASAEAIKSAAADIAGQAKQDNDKQDELDSINKLRRSTLPPLTPAMLEGLTESIRSRVK